MSKAALTSINPPHTNNIFSELKGIEWRTKPMPTGKHYCYETKKCFGVGKVIGEFRIWRVVRYENISMIPEGYIDSGCVPVEFLEAYSKGRPIYANFIKSPVKYDKPKGLSEFTYACPDNVKACKMCRHTIDGMKCKSITRPPQSWCYVEELKDI